MDNVLVRNEVTGTFWNFECKKTLGRSVGDGAIERVLAAERLGLKLSRERSKIIASSRNAVLLVILCMIMFEWKKFEAPLCLSELKV